MTPRRFKIFYKRTKDSADEAGKERAILFRTLGDLE